MRYFSEREGGEVPRESEEISETAWAGIRALIEARVQDGSFAATYKLTCFDGPVAIGTNVEGFRDAMRSQIPGLPEWPWREENSPWSDIQEIIETLAILDMIEFCWKCIGKPVSMGYHSYGGHDHLKFDVAVGRIEFRSEIELIFRRNGIAFTLTEEGQIERLVPLPFREAFVQSEFDTGDAELDHLLKTAQRKFVHPDPSIRKEALEALWDAWERLKTLDYPSNKAKSTTAMLDKVAGQHSPKFRTVLEKEARVLTNIGNELRTRHSETSQEQLASAEHIDYLFCRLFSLIRLALRSR